MGRKMVLILLLLGLVSLNLSAGTVMILMGEDRSGDLPDSVSKQLVTSLLMDQLFARGLICFDLTMDQVEFESAGDPELLDNRGRRVGADSVIAVRLFWTQRPDGVWSFRHLDYHYVESRSQRILASGRIGSNGLLATGNNFEVEKAQEIAAELIAALGLEGEAEW